MVYLDIPQEVCNITDIALLAPLKMRLAMVQLLHISQHTCSILSGPVVVTVPIKYPTLLVELSLGDTTQSSLGISLWEEITFR